MQLKMNFLFLKRSMSIHWDNGWVTSANDRFFDIESAARAQCVEYLTSQGRSPDEYQEQLVEVVARVRDKAASSLFSRPGLVHRLIDTAYRSNVFAHARSPLPKPPAALKREATYLGHRNGIELRAAQPPI